MINSYNGFMNLDAAQKSTNAFVLNYNLLKPYTDDFMYGIIAIRQSGNGAPFKIVDINKKAIELLKMDKKNIVGTDVMKTFPGAQEMGLRNSLSEVIKTGKPKYYKARKYQDEKIVLWVENYVVKLPSQELLVVFEDKTVEKQIERELHIILENTNDGYFKWYLKSGEVLYSEKWAEMLNYNKTEISEKIEAWESRLHPADRERVLRRLTTFIENKEEEILEISYRLERKNGTYASITSRIALLLDSERKPETIHNIHIDISDVEDIRRDIQSKVRELERLNNALVGRELKMIALKEKIKNLEKDAKK